MRERRVGAGREGKPDEAVSVAHAGFIVAKRVRRAQIAFVLENGAERTKNRAGVADLAGEPPGVDCIRAAWGGK